MLKVRMVVLTMAFSITWLGSVPTGNAGEIAQVASLARGGSAAGGITAKQTVMPGNYVVRTIWKGAPLPKVRVEWRRQVDDAAPALIKETIRFGTANFRPTSGSCYLTADWRPDGDFARSRKPGDRFAWLGGNPLSSRPKPEEK